MVRNISEHILNTAANLLGFCLFVITSLHITNYSEASMVDEFTSIIALMLIFSCLFSFLSIRTTKPIIEAKLESIADYLFIGALFGIAIIISLIAFKFIK
jgi:hypothetical protein